MSVNLYSYKIFKLLRCMYPGHDIHISGPCAKHILPSESYYMKEEKKAIKNKIHSYSHLF